MRSAALAAMLNLAGCDSTAPKDKAENIPVTDAATDELPPPVAAQPDPTTTTSPIAAKTEKHFQALGTEPFWSVEVMTGELRYSSPEVSGITFAASEAKDGKGVRYSGTMDGKALSLLIEPGKCSDGMSDTVYAWQAALTIVGKTEHGCARAK